MNYNIFFNELEKRSSTIPLHAYDIGSELVDMEDLDKRKKFNKHLLTAQNSLLGALVAYGNVPMIKGFLDKDKERYANAKAMKMNAIRNVLNKIRAKAYSPKTYGRISKSLPIAAIIAGGLAGSKIAGKLFDVLSD